MVLIELLWCDFRLVLFSLLVCLPLLSLLCLFTLCILVVLFDGFLCFGFNG